MLRATLFYPVDSYPLDRRFIHWISYPPFEQPAPELLNYQFKTLGSPLIDGIFLVQKMCIYSRVTLSTTLLIRPVQFNARSACDASMFTSCIYIFLRLASKCLNCTRSPEEMVQKLHKYD